MLTAAKKRKERFKKMFIKFSLASEQGLSFWERFLAWYEQSTVYELISYVRDRYFTLEFGVYENFSVATGLGESVRNIIIAFALALIIVSFMNAYTRQSLGGFVRRLLSEDCLSPDRAKTLSELGYFRSTSIRRALARGSALNLVVRRADGETDGTSDGSAEPQESETAEVKVEAEAEQENETASDADKRPTDTKIDFLTARFYIPEELKYRAEIRFRVKGSSWWMVALVSVLGIVIAALLCQLLPDVVAFADNIMTWLSPS